MSRGSFGSLLVELSEWPCCSPMAKRVRRREKTTVRRNPWLRRWLLRLSLLGLVFGVAQLAWLDLRVRAEFDGRRWAVPARIFARPLELYPGLRLRADDLEYELRLAGYLAQANTSRAGTYSRNGGAFLVRTRGFEFADGAEPASHFRVKIRGQAVESLVQNGQPLAIVRIDPALIARIFPAHHEDRVLVELASVPRLLTEGLIATEDRQFYEHRGVSVRGVARAMWANLRARKAVQGGSTLTQQLAKNFFLTHERSLLRKFREVLIAAILEIRYEKPEILEAYLNEVFLGQAGGRAIHGFGLASEYYFSRPLAELELSEMALLIALVRGASYYNPRRNPQRALARRNLVLDLMAGAGLIDDASAQTAKRAALGVAAAGHRMGTAPPAFIDLVRRHLRRDYHEDDLRSEGLRIFTTLDPSLQRASEHALSVGLKRLEAEKSQTAGSLQGAVVLTNSTTAEVLALAGDRQSARTGFNRALDARRPVGSVLKPAVYLAALEKVDRYRLSTLISDASVGIENEKGEVWAPENYDRQSHGEVPLYRALANSYNQATVRLGMTVGLENVLDVVHRLGVEHEIPAYPSILLGSVSLSPLEVGRMYQTLAGGGFDTPMRVIREVTGPHGDKLSRYDITVRQVIDSASVYLVNRALIEAMRHGTGRSLARRYPSLATVAGKTGTTNDLRDSWFAGFNGDHLAVIWLGRDDNGPTGLTGASGALSVWGDLMSVAGGRAFEPPIPDEIDWAWVLAETGQPSAKNCPGAVRLPIIRTEASPPAIATCADVTPSQQSVESVQRGTIAGDNR